MVSALAALALQASALPPVTRVDCPIESSDGGHSRSVFTLRGPGWTDDRGYTHYSDVSLETMAGERQVRTDRGTAVANHNLERNEVVRGSDGRPLPGFLSILVTLPGGFQIAMYGDMDHPLYRATEVWPHGHVTRYEGTCSVHRNWTTQ